MEWLVLASKLVISLGLLNVWLLRASKPTEWRGSGAKNMREEFAAYGLPAWFMGVVGFLKVTLAILLLASIWLPIIARPAAIGIAVLMIGAVSMHLKVGDPMRKSLPALSLLALCCLVILL
jgi:uncharacterized membrane protein YphA (DoxX/SURF4 family)